MYCRRCGKWTASGLSISNKKQMINNSDTWILLLAPFLRLLISNWPGFRNSQLQGAGGFAQGHCTKLHDQFKTPFTCLLQFCAYKGMRCEKRVKARTEGRETFLPDFAYCLPGPSFPMHCWRAGVALLRQRRGHSASFKFQSNIFKPQNTKPGAVAHT